MLFKNFTYQFGNFITILLPSCYKSGPTSLHLTEAEIRLAPASYNMKKAKFHMSDLRLPGVALSLIIVYNNKHIVLFFAYVLRNLGGSFPDWLFFFSSSSLLSLSDDDELEWDPRRSDSLLTMGVTNATDLVPGAGFPGCLGASTEASPFSICAGLVVIPNIRRTSTIYKSNWQIICIKILSNRKISFVWWGINFQCLVETLCSLLFHMIYIMLTKIT